MEIDHPVFIAANPAGRSRRPPPDAPSANEHRMSALSPQYATPMGTLDFRRLLWYDFEHGQVGDVEHLFKAAVPLALHQNQPHRFFLPLCRSQSRYPSAPL
jgi:hypothetical protein